MRKILLLLSLVLLSEASLQTYHYFFPTKIFFRHTYEQSKGLGFGEDFDFRLNSQGFKDLEFGIKKEGTFRIVAIGDSFAFGSVPYRDAFLTLLQKKLSTAGKQVELLNMGVPSLPPQEYVYLLGLEGLAMDPDMILLTLFVGDDFSASQAKSILDKSALVALGKKVLDSTKTFSGRILHKGRYCDTCPVLADALFMTIETEKAYLFEKENRTFGNELENVQYSLGRIRDICNREGIELFVVVIPDVVQIDTSLEATLRQNMSSVISEDSWDIEQPGRALTNWLNAKGIPSIDLYQGLKNSTVPVYKVSDVHWNIAGNKLAAEQVFSRLTTLLE